jgi:hypothetical protein
MYNKEKAKQNYIENRDKINEKSKQYYHDHKEERKTYNNNNNKIALMKIHQRQIICVEDWTRRPPRGPHPQGFT